MASKSLLSKKYRSKEVFLQLCRVWRVLWSFGLLPMKEGFLEFRKMTDLIKTQHKGLDRLDIRMFSLADDFRFREQIFRIRGSPFETET